MAVASKVLEAKWDVELNCLAAPLHDSSVQRNEKFVKELGHVVFSVDDRIEKKVTSAACILLNPVSDFVLHVLNIPPDVLSDHHSRP